MTVLSQGTLFFLHQMCGVTPKHATLIRTDGQEHFRWTLDFLARDLRSGKYQSEILLTIKAEYGGAIRHHTKLLVKKEKHPLR
ncbi:hypothetical protein J6590_073711 [Homalodisca vitripennis]|nr:hypothetical protein J6590_073711 [Homalodisca vitripennis]